MGNLAKADRPSAAPSFQDLILRLQRCWADQGCVILQPYDMEMGAGTFHPLTRADVTSDLGATSPRWGEVLSLSRPVFVSIETILL